MSEKSIRRVKNFYKRRGTVCFYTGINCTVEDGQSNSDLAASKEHLVPRARQYRKPIKNNIVVAARSINNTIGNAPLKVKYMLKKDLTEFVKTLPVDMPDLKKIRKCSKKVNEIFDQFRVLGILPWEAYNGIEDETERKLLRSVYVELLTPEERWVIFGDMN